MSCADCCGLNNTYTYCTDCECLDCDFVFDGDECVDSMTGSCEKEAWKGDAWCDDGNNNAACDWDGGDCCESNYTCIKNCRIVTNNAYNVTIDSFSTCDYIGTVHIRGSTYCEELESNFGCDCAGCSCSLGAADSTGCSCLLYTSDAADE